MNPYRFSDNYLHSSYDGDRFGFFFPFLIGAGIGGAAIGLTRPRPIYNVLPAYPPPVYGYSNYYGYYPPYYR